MFEEVILINLCILQCGINKIKSIPLISRELNKKSSH